MGTGTPARLLAGLCSLGIVAQASLFSQEPIPQDLLPQEPLRLRIGVTAVEIDAVVTGKGGRHVTDLRPEEFEIYQDGRKQNVVSAHYVPLAPDVDEEEDAASDRTLTATELARRPPTAREVRREEVRHTMAIIVDDLNLSFGSINRVRSALKQFVQQGLRDGDLISIIYTGRGVGRFQPFTTDRRALLRYADNLRFNRAHFVAVPAIPQVDARDGRPDSIATLRDDMLLAGSLGTARTVIRGMRDMPGRKSVVLVSDGWSPVTLPTGGPFGSTFPTVRPRIHDAIRHLVDEANRSFVVIYTMDARGVESADVFAAENGGTGSNEPGLSRQRMERFESHTGPRELADLGGGLYLRGNNNLALQMRRAMEDQRGYYLIGFQPNSDTFEKSDAPAKSERSQARFHDVKVRVTRPGLKVRARRGFFGLTDEDLAPPPRSREQRLLRVLHQPFASADIGMETSGLFWRHPAHGGMVRALRTIDPRTLTFRAEAQGPAHVPIEVGAALIDERGAIVSLRTLSLTVAGAADDASFIYPIDLPIVQPGAFQLRTAVRDMRSARQGSASEFIIVPDSKGSRLALSGLLLAGAPVNGPTVIETGMTATHASRRFAEAEEEFVATPAALNPARPEAADPVRRRFEPGMTLDYTYQIYNAERDKTTGRPALAATYRLFRDGTLVREGPLDPAVSDAPDETPATRKTALALGRLTLAEDLAPGTYDLEVVVTDTLGQKNRPATQWTAFTVSPRPADGGSAAPRGR